MVLPLETPQEYGKDGSLYLRLTKVWSEKFREALLHKRVLEKEALREALVRFPPVTWPLHVCRYCTVS